MANIWENSSRKFEFRSYLSYYNCTKVQNNNIILTFALVIVVTRCRPLKFHIQRIIDNRWDMEVNDSGGRGHISPPTETLLDVKSWTCCLPHERTGRDGVTKVHPASTTITRVIWKTWIEYYLYKVTLINWVESYIGFNYIINDKLCLFWWAMTTQQTSD